MAFSYDQRKSKEWWETKSDEEKFAILDETAIFHRERNLDRLRDKDVLFLYRRFSNEFQNK
jgi:hypothetical protein